VGWGRNYLDGCSGEDDATLDTETCEGREG